MTVLGSRVRSPECFLVIGRPYYRSRLCYRMSSVCRLSVCLSSVTFCIQAKRLDRFAWNFQGRCGLTVGRPDYILGQSGETARCCDTNFFVSNITRKRLDRFAWMHHSFCIIVCYRAVRSAILPTAGLLVEYATWEGRWQKEKSASLHPKQESRRLQPRLWPVRCCHRCVGPRLNY